MPLHASELDEALDDGVSPVRMYEPPMPSSKGAQTAGPLHSKRRRSRGLSTMSAFSLTQGGYDAGEMMWEDRVWLLGYRVDRWLFKGIPYGYPLRAKVKISLQASTAGWAWDMFQTLASLLSCLLYVLSTYDIIAPAPVEWALTGVFTIELLLRYCVAEDKLMHTFKRSTLIDWVTVLPAYLEFAMAHSDAQTGTRLHFLRIIRVTRVFRVARTMKIMDQRRLSKTTRQYGTLILSVLALVFIAAGIVQLVEKDMDFATAVYFMIVTMSTVGYGDIKPTTPLSRIVVSVIIIVAWIYIPYEISKLFQVLSARSQYRTRVPRFSHAAKARRPGHVLLLGDVTNVYKLQKFVSEFYHPDRPAAARCTRLVIVGPDEPVRELRELMLNPILEGRVSYVKASVMRENDLERVAADEAEAAFILSDWLSAQSPDKEDGRAIIRTLMINNFAPRVPCFVQLAEPHSIFQLSLSPGNHVLCADSLKMAILGLAVANPGITTLVTNLMTSSRAADARVHSRGASPPWMDEYLEGTNFELYVTTLPPALEGMAFHEAALFVYAHTAGRVLLLGLKEAEQEPLPPGLASPVPPPPRLLCNPGPLYTIPSTAPDSALDGSKTKPPPAQAAPSPPTAAGGPSPPATSDPASVTASGVLKGMQAVFLAADAEEVDRLQTLRPPPRPEANDGLNASGHGRRHSRSGSFTAQLVEDVRAALSASIGPHGGNHRGSRSLSATLAAGLGFGGGGSAAVAPAPSPLSPMGGGGGGGGGGRRIVELSVGPSSLASSVSEGPLSPPQEEEEGQASHVLSMSMPANRKGEGEDGTAIPSSPSSSPAPAQPALQQTIAISRTSSFGSSLSSSSSSSSSLLASTLPPPPPEDGVAEDEQEGSEESMPAAAPTATATTAPPSSPPSPQPRQQQQQQPSRRPQGQVGQHHRAHAFSLGGHGSMEEYLASLAAEGQCLEVARDGVRRRGLRAVRGMEGHVLVVSQLASLPCLGYFLAPLRQGATDSAITPSTSSNSIDAADDATPTPTPTPNPPALNGPPVVILISHTAEPGSAASSALAAALQGGGQGPPTTQGASRRKGLRKVIEGLRRFGPIYLVEGDASTEEGLVKAGLERARACVMLADKTSTKLVDGRHFVDNASLRRFLSTQKFLFDAHAAALMRPDFVYLAEVQSSTTLRIMDRYQEKIRTAPRALLLHSMRELSYHGGAGGTVKRVSQTAKALGTAALGTLKRNASFRGGDELEARFEASRAVSFGVKEAYMLPFFAAGRGFITHLFDSLPCQAYYSADAVRFFELMLGHAPDPDNADLLFQPGYASSSSGGHKRQSHRHHQHHSAATEDTTAVPPPPPYRGHLRRVPIPPAFLLDPTERERGCGLLAPPARPTPLSPKACSSVGGGGGGGGGGGESMGGGSGVWEGMMAAPTFGALVRYMLLTRGLFPLGLYRLCPATSQHYVVTAPPASLVLEPSDYAFVLMPGGSLLPQQEAQLRADERERQMAERACAAYQQRQHGQRLGPGAGADGGSSPSSQASGAARLQALFLNLHLPNGA